MKCHRICGLHVLSLDVNGKGTEHDQVKHLGPLLLTGRSASSHTVMNIAQERRSTRAEPQKQEVLLRTNICAERGMTPCLSGTNAPAMQHVKKKIHKVLRMPRRLPAEKRRWIQKTSSQHSNLSGGISIVTQCGEDAATFRFLHPFIWPVRRKRAPISSETPHSHTSYKGCEVPRRRALQSTIALPSLSCRSLTSAPRSVADCAPTKLQPRCRGIRHEDAESKAIVPGPPVLPCRQTWKRPRVVADAASRGAAVEIVASQAR